jgi:hypothetical protein
MKMDFPKTKEAFEIIKARWPEVVFIIALGVISLSINLIPIVFHLTGKLGYMLLAIVPITSYIIFLIFITGFQRTVYLENGKRQSPLILLREGKHFFLRLVGLSLIYFLAGVCLQFLVYWAVRHAAPNFMETGRGISLINLLLSTFLSLILMKIILLMFPIIIVLDCGIFESFKILGRCRLKDARELVILFLVSLGLPFLWELLPYHQGVTILHYFIMILRVIASQFIDLMVVVMAVRYVAAQNLRYDNSLEPLDSQDLLNSSI